MKLRATLRRMKMKMKKARKRSPPKSPQRRLCVCLSILNNDLVGEVTTFEAAAASSEDEAMVNAEVAVAALIATAVGAEVVVK